MQSITRGRSLADGPTIGRPGDDASPNAAPEPPRRKLARDKRNGRVGEIMPHPIPAHLCSPATPPNVMLRPVGGGCEWPVPPEYIEDVAHEVAA